MVGIIFEKTCLPDKAPHCNRRSLARSHACTTKNLAFYVVDSKTVVKDRLRKCSGGIFAINSNVTTMFSPDRR